MEDSIQEVLLQSKAFLFNSFKLESLDEVSFSISTETTIAVWVTVLVTISLVISYLLFFRVKKPVGTKRKAKRKPKRKKTVKNPTKHRNSLIPESPLSVRTNRKRNSFTLPTDDVINTSYQDETDGECDIQYDDDYDDDDDDDDDVSDDDDADDDDNSDDDNNDDDDDDDDDDDEDDDQFNVNYQYDIVEEDCEEGSHADTSISTTEVDAPETYWVQQEIEKEKEINARISDLPILKRVNGIHDSWRNSQIAEISVIGTIVNTEVQNLSVNLKKRQSVANSNFQSIQRKYIHSHLKLCRKIEKNFRESLKKQEITFSTFDFENYINKNLATDTTLCLDHGSSHQSSDIVIVKEHGFELPKCNDPRVLNCWKACLIEYFSQVAEIYRKKMNEELREIESFQNLQLEVLKKDEDNFFEKMRMDFVNKRSDFERTQLFNDVKANLNVFNKNTLKKRKLVKEEKLQQFNRELDDLRNTLQEQEGKRREQVIYKMNHQVTQVKTFYEHQLESLDQKCSVLNSYGNNKRSLSLRKNQRKSISSQS